MRVVPLNRDVICHGIPVDYCVNLMLSACWKTAQLAAQGIRPSPPNIYNYVPHPNNPLKSGDLVQHVENLRMVCPLENSIWYPITIPILNPLLYKLGIIFLHLVPGYILDVILRLQGKKPRLIPLYQKIEKNMDVLRYFLNTPLTFDISKADGLWKSMSKTDQQLFPFDIEFFDWAKYWDRACRGMRIYLGKQDPSDEAIQRAIKRTGRYLIP